MKKYVVILVLTLTLGFTPLSVLTPPAHATSCPNTPNAPNTIEGCVVNSNTSSPVPGLNVYLVSCGNFMQSAYTTTDGNGHFIFHGSSGQICIFQNLKYPVSVNGITPLTSIPGCYFPSCNVLGQAADNLAWGQWVGDVQTDPTYGYGFVIIQLDPAQIGIVPLVSLYSNTQFVSMTSSVSQSSGQSNTVGVSLSIGGSATIRAGFESTVSWTSTNRLDQPANSAGYLGQPSYVIDYYCAGSTAYNNTNSGTYWGCTRGVKNAGVTEPALQPNGQPYGWNGYATSEYLNPNSPPNPSQTLDCWWMSAAGGQSITKSFTWSSATTTTIGGTIGTQAFTFRGVPVTLGFSFASGSSSGTSDTSSVTISTNGQNIQFRLYPAGGTCGNPVLSQSSSELHVWDMTGDFGMSASPNSVSILFPGSTNSSTISVTSLSGFSEAVSLSATAPSGIFASLSPNRVSLTSGGSATSTATISANPSMPIGTYTVTIMGSSATATHSVNIAVTIVTSSAGGGGGSGGGGGGGKGCPCKI